MAGLELSIAKEFATYEYYLAIHEKGLKRANDLLAAAEKDREKNTPSALLKATHKVEDAQFAKRKSELHFRQHAKWHLENILRTYEALESKELQGKHTITDRIKVIRGHAKEILEAFRNPPAGQKPAENP